MNTKNINLEKAWHDNDLWVQYRKGPTPSRKIVGLFDNFFRTIKLLAGTGLLLIISAFIFGPPLVFVGAGLAMFSLAWTVYQVWAAMLVVSRTLHWFEEKAFEDFVRESKLDTTLDAERINDDGYSTFTSSLVRRMPAHYHLVAFSFVAPCMLVVAGFLTFRKLYSLVETNSWFVQNESFERTLQWLFLTVGVLLWQWGLRFFRRRAAAESARITDGISPRYL